MQRNDNPLTDRQGNYDLLRVISCIAIIVLHASVRWVYGSNESDIFGVRVSNYVMPTAYNVLSRFAVPCFIMMAGAFAISNPKNANYKLYYKKIFSRIYAPTLLFSVLYVLWGLFRQALNVANGRAKAWTLLTPLQQAIIGRPSHHLWYLFMMIGLYLLVPAIIVIKKDIDISTIRKISICAVIVQMITGWTSNDLFEWGIKSFSYIGYFLIGYVVYDKANNEKNVYKAIVCNLSGMALLLIQTYVQWLHLSKGIVEAEEQYTLTGPLNPVITIASILIFIGFANITIKHDLSKLASVSFLVYLIHIFVLQNIEHIMAKPMFANEGWICIPAEAIIVFIASYVLALLYLKIKKLLLRTAQQISV